MLSVYNFDYSLLPIQIIDFEKYNFDQFIKNLDLSFRYEPILLIFGMIIYPMIAILVISKIFRSPKITYFKNIIILIYSIFIVYSLPFHIVDIHNEYLAEKKQESIRLENEQKEIVRINSNSELLHIYRGYEDMRKLICLDYYYRENDGCKKQEEKCKNIKYMFKDSVKPEDVELLEKMKAGCSYNGWF
ncbi:hypothetical protein [Anabaena sp. UHCC 0451]|uniref:hypothetical protein n=1 Tax=Anabaena sp. UHCC 0451 TaxID=2055235 RepID=UPI002B21A867|nr:hypothetical protein [Anabaena sp. UHCC 0451]MEA5575492.1 hypothetical protein [Anabaena sp. UHCC 0451]